MFKEQIIDPIMRNLFEGKDRNAFCIKDEFFTYGQFADKITNIRSLLQARKPQNKNVGLVTNNDIETYASIIALWLDGYCYVPLHIKQPIDRCLDIVKQVGIDTILDSSNKSRYDLSLVVTLTEKAELTANLEPKKDISDNDLAYILFTS